MGQKEIYLGPRPSITENPEPPGEYTVAQQAMAFGVPEHELTGISPSEKIAIEGGREGLGQTSDAAAME